MSTKITIVGAGNVGATICYELAQRSLCSNIVFLDIEENVVRGKALDIEQSLAISGSSTTITPTTSYEATKDSDIVVITAGSPRKPGMSRDDLLLLNAKITSSIALNIATFSPNSIIIEVANPLDAMVYVALKSSGFQREKVIGMAGILDSARMSAYIASTCNMPYNQIQAMVLGSHGDSMVPLLNHTTINGAKVSHFVTDKILKEIIKKTKNGGAEIVSYLQTSAYYAPAFATIKMIKAILLDTKTLYPCSIYLQGEYGYKDTVTGVPIVLGKNGAEKIEVFHLEPYEKKALDKSASDTKSLLEILYKNGY